METPVQTSAQTPAAAEAQRIMTICNACRYCEGLCATFQAMAEQRAFVTQDLEYLANLCHNCTACYHDCQYAPPHEFDVNVPRTLAALRAETYASYAWPGPLARLFRNNGLVVALATALTLTAVILAALLLIDPAVLYTAHEGAGAFYRVIGHGAMVAVAGATFAFSMLALTMGYLRFSRAIAIPSAGDRRQRGTAGRAPFRAIVDALADAAVLKNLDGGHGEGCNTRDDRPSNARRFWHQATMWGFLLCFAATLAATFYHYVLGRAAPYPLSSLPVVLGVLGGLGLIAGPAGLAVVKRRSDPRPMLLRSYGMDYAFLALLFTVSLTGLALLVFRDTAAMGILLVVHLGFVLALFLVLPYSKFVHAVYRLAALVRFARSRQQRAPVAGPD